MSKDNSGPAFPQHVMSGLGEYIEGLGPRPIFEMRGGLKKRELFAAMAMQAIVSNSEILIRFEIPADEVAKKATEYADALIAALANQ